MLRTFGKTVGTALAALGLVATLAVAADIEMTCTKVDGKGTCTAGEMAGTRQEHVVIGPEVKVGEKMVCHHGQNVVYCVKK
jgi:hypothetical protein